MLNLSTAILGKNIVARLQARETAPVLVIGSDEFTRPQLSKIGCFNFLAASRLSQFIAELKVRDTGDLFRRIPPAHLALPGLGAICLATIGAAFEVKKLGTLADYIGRHMEKGEYLVTFATMKTNVRDVQAARAEKKNARDRKRRRNAAAHELRVERHVARHVH